MPNPVTTYQELRKRYASGWVPPATEFPNEKFDTPKDIWARFTIRNGEELQMDIGDSQKTFRLRGQLIIQLFAPELSGSVDVLERGNELAGVFRNWCGVTVSCQAATVIDVGNDDEGWYQVNVIVPFKVDGLH